LGLIQSEFIDVDIDLSLYDSLIFTSTNSVRAIKKYHKDLKTKDIYSIGEATTKALNQIGVTPVFSGVDLSGDEFATALIPKLKNRKTLFPHAYTMVSKSLEIFANANLDLDDIIVYKTICHDSAVDLKKGAIIIFSSPSTIECFFKNYNWDSSYKAVVIGTTTASYMPQDIEYSTSEHQTINSCMDCAMMLHPHK
jgi:uroporphyrinogen-III synthase